MNPFYDISSMSTLPDGQLSLPNLGDERASITLGRRPSEYWGTSGRASETFYRATKPKDYDSLFINKLCKWMPVYELDRFVDHHYTYYKSNFPDTASIFLKHMRYIILPQLEKRKNCESVIELFKDWLNRSDLSKLNNSKFQTVNNNTINVGNINAPTQFQQNSDHSTQHQNVQYRAEDVKTAFELLKKDIKDLKEETLENFLIEMEYATAQLERNKDIRPQLSNIGNLIKEIGMGTFTNLLASPIFEFIKPFLNLV